MSDKFDVIVIGGGATGLGVAVEARSRGYTTLLLEAYDFGKGTSSKSTKLVHGGIRYLANFDFKLVKEGLIERFNFLNNAPHLAKSQSYLVPFYSLSDKLKYWLGIKLYDFLSGNKKIGNSQFLSKAQVLADAPHLNPKGLQGGAIYFDGQFDDSRMLITLLATLQHLGGVAHNYHEVVGFIKNQESKIIGVKVFDKLNNREFNVYAKVIINATGILTDQILDLAEPLVKHQQITAAQGSHLVFDSKIFASKHAIVIPKTIDNRILFVLPWHEKVIVGTTDIPVSQPQLDPLAQDTEIAFILNTLNQYTVKKVTKADIKAIFAGQRPLVCQPNQTKTAKISRKHEILYSASGLISIVGGKWTIYRLMGEDTINFAIKHKLLNYSQSITQNLHLFGYTKAQEAYPFSVYGSNKEKIIQIQQEMQCFAKLHPNLPYYLAEVIYQVRYEMAKTIEDILARRTRALILDARAALQVAPTVAKLMAQELNKDNTWVKQQLQEFNVIAQQYLI